METKYPYEHLKKALTEEAITSITQKPIKSTTIERFHLHHEANLLYKDLPQPLKYGKGVYYLLERCSLPITDTDLLLGRIVDRELTEEEESVYQSVKQAYGVRPEWLTDGGHRSFWWEGLLKYGLTGLRAQAASELKRRQDKGKTTQDRLDFLAGMILVYDALLLYLSRYADAAEKAGMTEAAMICREITAHEPRSFRQAMQLFWIVHLVYCSYIAINPTLTLGRMDMLLENLYEQDKAAGHITEEDARLLILDFYCKHNLILGRGEHQMSVRDFSGFTGWDRNLCYDAPQYLLLGGRRRDGSYLDGELTHLFAEMIEPGFKNPVIEIRYAPDMQKKCPKLWRTIVNKAKHNASLLIYQEEDIISAFLRSGVDPEDAMDFEHYGCNHATMPGLEFMGEYSHFVPLFNFMDILRNWVNKGHEPQTSEELFDKITEDCRAHCHGIIDRLINDWRKRTEKPITHLEMTDCFSVYPIPAASSYQSYGSKYIFSNILIGQFASFVDTYTAVDELVIKQKKMTLAHLMKAVDANFQGYPVELALCKKAPKLGSDEPAVNRNAKLLMTQFTDDISRLSTQKLSAYNQQSTSKDYPVIPRPLVRISMETDNSHRLGETMGATPDGRLAGVPLSQNAGPALGACTAGLTARLCSVASIPFDRIVAGAQNLSISPRTFSGEEGLDKLATIMGSYFDMGGLQLQITSVDPNMLLEAQKHPEQYRDLMVRITGYSAVFVDMEKHAQDDIIKREVMAH